MCGATHVFNRHVASPTSSKRPLKVRTKSLASTMVLQCYGTLNSEHSGYLWKPSTSSNKKNQHLLGHYHYVPDTTFCHLLCLNGLGTLGQIKLYKIYGVIGFSCDK